MVLRNENAANCVSVGRKWSCVAIYEASGYNNNCLALGALGFVEVKRSVLKSENRNVYSVEIKR